MFITLSDGRVVKSSTVNASGYVANKIEMEARDFKDLADMVHTNPHELYARLIQLSGRFASERAGYEPIPMQAPEHEDQSSTRTETTILNLRPGDVLVASVDKPISEETSDRLTKHWGQVLKDRGFDNEVLIVEDGIKLSVLRPEKGE